MLLSITFSIVLHILLLFSKEKKEKKETKLKIALSTHIQKNTTNCSYLEIN